MFALNSIHGFKSVVNPLVRAKSDPALSPNLSVTVDELVASSPISITILSPFEEETLARVCADSAIVLKIVLMEPVVTIASSDVVVVSEW